MEKRLDWKNRVDFKNYDVAIWKTNKLNKHIAQCQGILYVDGWCDSFKILYFFFKTLINLL